MSHQLKKMEDVMKRVPSLLIIVLFTLTGLYAELINLNPDPSGEPWLVGGVVWDEKEMLWYNSLPVFTPSIPSALLPVKIDNSKNPYFRSIFTQYGGCCAQASTIGYTFTYEINRLKNQSVIDIEPRDHEQYRFPTHFTYNFYNKGNPTVVSPCF